MPTGNVNSPGVVRCDPGAAEIANMVAVPFTSVIGIESFPVGPTRDKTMPMPMPMEENE